MREWRRDLVEWLDSSWSRLEVEQVVNGEVKMFVCLQLEWKGKLDASETKSRWNEKEKIRKFGKSERRTEITLSNPTFASRADQLLIRVIRITRLKFSEQVVGILWFEKLAFLFVRSFLLLSCFFCSSPSRW